MALVDLDIDLNEVKKATMRMRQSFAPETMERIMHDTAIDTARKTKTIVKKIASREYNVTQAWAGKQVMAPRISGINAEIPLKGERGVIGKTFPMQASHAKGAKTKSGKMDRRKVVKAAKIKRGQWSRLPSKTPHQGGHGIFPVNGVAATRSDSGKQVRVVGRSLPHMIVNSPYRKEAEQEIDKYAGERMDHHIARALNNWA